MKPFTANEFLNATPTERIHWCRAMAVEAVKLSAATESNLLRTAYRNLAKQLSVVADQVAGESVLCQAISREMRQDLH